MNKVIPQVCPVCNEQLNLSRREIQDFTARVKGVLRGKYFISEEMAQNAIHVAHQKKVVTN